MRSLKFTEQFRRRFMSKYQEGGGCWGWTGIRSRKGYALIWCDGNTRRAHRVMWRLAVSEIPPGKQILHHCDNPSCVRPDHLFLGTNEINVSDKVSKGRQVRGERIHVAKLTEANVREIRGMSGTLSEIAEAFGVHLGTIHSVKAKRNWKHV